jgi:hypothetical protein
MIYRVRKLHYFSQSIIPVGWLVTVVWLNIENNIEIDLVLLTAGIAAIFLTIYIYVFHKQLKTPLVETTEREIKIHNVWNKPERAAWNMIMEIKKHPLLGYKLKTLDGSIWIPTGMLTKSDSQQLIEEVTRHVKK